MARLAVFDIDGTLTDTNAVDAECFLRAVAEALEIDAAKLDWSAAPHITDEALLLWLAEQHGCRPLSDHDRRAVVDRFVELLEAEKSSSPERFRPVAGASHLFAEVRRAGWSCALATGGWERSARLKLAAASLNEDGLALASSNDALTRVRIMQEAVRRATPVGLTFHRIVSSGHGAWDVLAAAMLHWPFVGIASGARDTVLRDHGAPTVIADFSDVAAVMRALDTAKPPSVALSAPVV